MDTFLCYSIPFPGAEEDISSIFLASQDALEVMSVTDSLTDSVIVRIDLTDVTLVSEDTFRRLRY